MTSHKLQKNWKDRLKSAVPFGLGQAKPKHFRDMGQVIWKNRDNLGYAYKVLSRGVCDGCALGVAGFHDWTIKGVHLCMTRLNLLRLNTMPALDVKILEDVANLSKLDNAQLRELGRLPYPMLRGKSAKGFRRISWDEAYARIGKKLRATDPKRWAMFVTSRGVTNEIYYMAQKVARFLGTNNVDNAARLCHAPSTAAMKAAVGVAATTCSYKDWYGTDLIIFFGANPANDQPVTTKYLHEAKQLGTKVIMVNPYLEPGMKRYWVPSTMSSALFGTDIADYWFPVSQGGDIAFIYGVLKVIFANGWEDENFVKNYAVGFEELRKQTEQMDWAVLEKQSGMGRASMEEFAELIHQAKNAVLVWSMGITQHVFGANAVQMVLNLGLVKGYVGRDKCGLMPIRGHSSVQGGAEMGAYATALPGGKPVNAENAQKLSAEYGFKIPEWVGLTTTEMVEACARGEMDVLYCLGGNFLRTLPDPKYVQQALANVPMRVHQDIILTDQMFIEAKEEVILLPAKTRYEQDDGGTETITERRIAFTPEIPRQVGEAKAEWKILRELAAAAYPEKAHLLGCETGWKMREEIARVVPFYDGFQKLNKTGEAFQYGGPHLCADWKFNTPDGKAHFCPVPLPDLNRKQGEFKVSTRRGKQFNTLIYAEIDPLNQAPRDAVLMNPDDAAELHLVHEDRVLLKNELGHYEGLVFLAPIARGNLQIHWPEGNVIVQRGMVDPAGMVPDYNAWVRVEKV
ncbi:FdhF/YdeP family oxidoreductase [Pedosphaera parvula]|uniref:Oxidoreductase alpha (Molybdopterin) subunit n=1 Tax=Pedosphaera parvula (strain Ellin514) TaxID=320771 RepID=B9XQ03_PEDPL|nr:FdhF/YdeP family oxidoreductase [Pedosphaera parvula]EEF58100.1 oxidoreductase alpha (molybdopterin) subunit [Pedosphaera parvula Ellin514]